MTTPRDTVENFWERAPIDAALTRECTPAQFKDALRSYLGVRAEMRLAARATSGLRAILDACAPMGSYKRNRVLVCAFNCPLVIETVLEAALEPDAFDLERPDGAIDWETLAGRLDGNRHLAVIIPHLYGVPQDFTPLLHEARRQQILVIEDAAHTLGGLIGERTAGTYGDFGIFSFNYDKPLSLGGGGAIVQMCEQPVLAGSEPVAVPFQAERRELAAIQAALHWRRRRIAYKGHFAEAFDRLWERLGFASATVPGTSGVGAARAALGCEALRQYPGIVERRNYVARRLGNAARYPWRVGSTVTPAWLKQRILGRSAESILAVTSELQALGLRVGRYNWPRLHYALDGVRFPAACEAAALGVDFPVHQNLSEDQVEVLEQAARAL